jgi:hypothetical protein
VFFPEPRRRAGLSERFIRELEVFTGSKGRPPVFWFFNPLCDAEIARGAPGHTPAEPARRLCGDLGTLLMYLALDTDVCLVPEIPRAAWLKELQDLGFPLPEFRLLGRPGEAPREAKMAGIEPWGWSPEPFERFKAWRDRLIQVDGANGAWSGRVLAHADFAASGLGELFSKVWSARFLREWLAAHPETAPIFGGPEDTGGIFTTWEAAREALARALRAGRTLVAKAPFGTSGAQNKRVLRESELDSPLGGWIRNTIETQGAIVLEPWLEKQADLSMQIEISARTTRIVGIRHFLNGSRNEYRGTYLDAKLRSLTPDALRFLHGAPSPLETWQRLAEDLGAALRAKGYEGPAGIDGLIHRQGETLRLKPLVELNPRWTMGRVAIALEAQVVPGTPAAWAFLTASAETRELARRFPPRAEPSGGGRRIAEGVVFTTDPERAREVMTALVVGPRPLESIFG